MTLYQQLKASSNPQAPVQVALTLLASHSVREVARILGVSPRWVYTLRKRYREGGDWNACLRKRGPKNPMPNRTPQHLEELVVTMAQETNFGPRRLSVVLAQAHGVSLPPSTIRNILRRHSIRCRKYRTGNGGRRYGVHLSAFQPLEFWQIDVKDIADQKALPPSAYGSIFREKLPRYQFTACEVRTRVRCIAYAHELYALSSLPSGSGLLGCREDNGAEFGGLGNSRKRLLTRVHLRPPWGDAPLYPSPRENSEHLCGAFTPYR